MPKIYTMKHLSLLILLLLFNYGANAQTKAIPPYEPEQFVRNIIQELDIPDETFDKMRGKDNVIQLKIFLNEKGEAVKTIVADDEFGLGVLIFPIVKQFPSFTPVIVDGIAKGSMYSMSFVINDYNYFKRVRQSATPEVGIERFVDKVRDNFYLTSLERAKLSAAKIKENYDIIIDFIVEKDGTLCCFRMANKEMEYFEDRMIKAVKRASKKWIPGTLNGAPVRTKFSYTLTLKADFHSLNI